MTTETEKLKKRLKFMKNELTLRQHKLKRHTQNKEAKFTDEKAKSSQKLSDISNEFSYILEASTDASNNSNISIAGKYDEDFLSSLNEHDLTCIVDLKDDVQGVLMTINNRDTHIASKPEVTQNNTRKNVTLNAVDPEIASSADKNVLEEDSSCSIQSDISKEDSAQTVGTDFLEESIYSTPKKSMTHESKSDLSPILMQGNGVTKISAKPKTRLMMKRMKGLMPSNKSKRKEFLKQIPMTLNHGILCTVKPNDLTFPSDVINSANITDTQVDDAVPVEEHGVPKEPQRNAFVTFPPCLVEGQILAAFFEDCILVLVHELQVSFWRFFKRKEPPWLHVGMLPRKQLHCGISVGCQGSRVNIGSEQMFICSEVWTHDEQERIVLTCVMYSYSKVNAGFKTCCLELKRVPRFIKDIKFCIGPDFSIVVSWQHRDSVVSTVVTKFNIDIESRLVQKSTQLVPVMESIKSVHCLQGCRSVVIGDSTSQIFLWNHCTGALVTAVKCPEHDAKLQWAGEDQGFLFAVFTTVTHVELITVNLTTGKHKQVREYLLPETKKLLGISIECGKMIAVFSEGFMCWDLVAGTDTTQDTGQQTLFCGSVKSKLA